MTKLEKLYSIIDNSYDVGVKLPKDVLKQVNELEEKIIKDERGCSCPNQAYRERDKGIEGYFP